MTVEIAIIGGTGLSSMEDLEIVETQAIETPFGHPSSPIIIGQLHNTDVAFLARHGARHTIPPHKINYRANLWALKSIGVRTVVAVAAVGGIRQDMAPGLIAIPDQIIDYSYGRQMTFFEDDLEAVTHIDFTQPYCQTLRLRIIKAARSVAISVIEYGTYACTQGPRLETSAEVSKLERDGCDMVGMTAMPEAALARELEIDYACCAAVANWAAGKTDGIISMEEIAKNLDSAMGDAIKILKQLVAG